MRHRTGEYHCGPVPGANARGQPFRRLRNRDLSAWEEPRAEEAGKRLRMAHLRSLIVENETGFPEYDALVFEGRRYTNRTLGPNRAGLPERCAASAWVRAIGSAPPAQLPRGLDCLSCLLPSERDRHSDHERVDRRRSRISARRLRCQDRPLEPGAGSQADFRARTMSRAHACGPNRRLTSGRGHYEEIVADAPSWTASTDATRTWRH